MIRSHLQLPVLMLGLFITSCSNIKSIEPHSTLEKDSQSLSREEKERRQNIELYQKMRQENWRKYQKRPNRNKSNTSAKAVAKKKPMTQMEPEVFQMIVSQRVSFFCIKYSDSEKFKQASCEVYAQNVLENCHAQFEGTSPEIIDCLKHNLTP